MDVDSSAMPDCRPRSVTFEDVARERVGVFAWAEAIGEPHHRRAEQAHRQQTERDAAR